MSEIAPKNCSGDYGDYADDLHEVRGIVLNTSLQRPHAFPRKCPRFGATEPVRAGTRGEIGIRRANYTFGYFAVLPACGSRNDRLFINDLSLGDSTDDYPAVPRKSVSRSKISQSGARSSSCPCDGTLTFRIIVRGS